MEITSFTLSDREGAQCVFDFVINERFDFSVKVIITDSNKDELDVDVDKVYGVQSVFDPNDNHRQLILESVNEYLDENGQEFRESAQDWVEYYGELDGDHAKLSYI